MAMMAKTFSPLRHSTFRSFWLANLSVTMGVMVQTVGAGWMMTTLTTSSDLVALVTAASALPVVLFSSISGAIADSYDRRSVMLIAQCGMLLTSIVIVALTLTGWMTPLGLLALTTLLGFGTALHTPSWQSSFQDFVPRHDLPSAVALVGMGFNLTRGAGPAIGGLIIAAWGTLFAFVANALSYLPMIVALLAWRPERKTSELPREALLPAVGAGLRYASMSPHLQAVFLRAFVFGLSAIPILALLPIVAKGRYGGDALLYGLLFGAFGFGGVIGALSSGTFRARVPAEWITRLSFCGLSACALMLAWSPWPSLTVAGLLVGGACWVLSLSLFNISVQLATPRWVVGRVLSLYHTSNFGGQALGAWLSGVLSSQFGIPWVLTLSAAMLLIGLSIGFVPALRLPALSTADLDPNNLWTRPRIEPPILPRSGPIKIMIEYDIDEVDVSAFLTIMEERHRVRRRDGARYWTLLRDLERPSLWIETYQFPTWLEYERCNQRGTLADIHINKGLKSLHRGDGAPRVRRTIERHVRWHSVERGMPSLLHDH